MPLYPDDFEQFWQAWPLGYRANKVVAVKSWAKLKPSPALVETIIKSVEKHKQSKKWLEGFIPNPTTWLNQERWNNELPEFDKPPPPKLAPNAPSWRDDDNYKSTISIEHGRLAARLLAKTGSGELKGQKLIEACAYMEKRWPDYGWGNLVVYYKGKEK